MSWLRRNRARLLVGGLLLFAFLLFTAQVKEPRRLNWLDRALLWATAPIQYAVVWVVDGAVVLWKDYIYLVGLREENQRLKQEIDGLWRTVDRLSETEAENLRLKELVNMHGRLENARLVTARVVGVGTSPVSRVIRISAGSDHGVKAGDAVIAGAGLVGRVSGTVGSYSEVQLMVDSRCAVDVVIQRSRARGIVRGQGEDEVCSVDHLVRTADVEVGDRAVTSGIGGVYPRGLLVGTVSRVTSPRVGEFREADLQPAVAFQSLEEVLVNIGSGQQSGKEEEAEQK